MKICLRLAALLALCAATVSGQQPAPAPAAAPADSQAPPVTFRVEVDYVEVDAIVTDQQGNLVSNLTANDFELREDGKVQKINTFALVNLPITRPEQPLFATAPIEPDVQTNERMDGRVYLIVLDNYHTDALNALKVKAAAKQFIERRLGANDVAAIVHTSGRSDNGQDFTNNRRLLMASVDKFIGEAPRSATLERIDRYNQLGVTQQANPVNSRDQSVYDPLEFERRQNAQSFLGTMKKLAEFMAGVRGRRKALILISEGLPYDMSDAFSDVGGRVVDDFRDAISAATRANVAIYAIDPKGLDSGGGGADIEGFPSARSGDSGSEPTPVPQGLNLSSLMSETRMAQDSLRMMAEQTGGIASVNRNDFASAFERIVQENSTYYVLAYYPANDKRDGKFRKIELRVKRPGLQVRARRGYYAPRGRAAEAKPASTTTPPALREAMNSPLPMSGIPMRVFVGATKGAAPKAMVAIAAEIRAGDFKYTERSGANVNSVELSTTAVDSTGKVAASKRHTVNLAFKPDTLARVKEFGFRVLTSLELAPGHYQLRVAVAEQNGSTSGSVLYDLDVPDFWKAPLTMSHIMLTSAGAARAPSAGDAGPVGQLMPAPLATQREFERNDEIALLAEVYENMPNAAAHKLDITTTIRTNDGRQVLQNKEERDSSELQGGRGGYGYGARIPLKDFAPGLYVLRVEARSRMGNQAGVGREVLLRVK